MDLSNPVVALVAMVPVLASLLLGAQLRVEYLRQVMRHPRALVAGLAGQYLLLPLLALAFFYLHPASGRVGWAWFILAAVPGGAVSNMVTFLGRGRLSLSVVLTACSTLSGMITIPLWVNLGAALAGGGVQASLPIAGMVLGSFVLLVVPLGLGIGAGIWRPTLAERMRRFTRVAMVVLLVVGLGAYLVQRWDFIARDFDLAICIGGVLFHVAAVGGGWGLAWGAGLDREDRFTIGMEVGVQNVVVAVLIIELLGRSDLVPIVGYYAFAMLVLLAVWVPRLGGAPEPACR